MRDVTYFFSTAEPLLRLLVVGTLLYLGLVILLRTAGGRSLSQMTAYDFIVNVAIGAVLGRSLTAHGVSLAEGILALALLLTLQYVLARTQTRSRRLSQIVSNSPALLFLQGTFRDDALDRHRLTEADVRAAARKEGFGSMSQVDAVILESNGDLSVVGELGDGSALGSSLLGGAGPSGPPVRERVSSRARCPVGAPLHPPRGRCRRSGRPPEGGCGRLDG